MSAICAQKGMKAADVRLKAEMIQFNSDILSITISWFFELHEIGTGRTEVRCYPRQSACDAIKPLLATISYGNSEAALTWSCLMLVEQRGRQDQE